jgi:hypothetical protein
MARLTRSEARDILQRCKVAIGSDFHRLDSETVERLLSEADARGYRKPKNANGSRGRYFHAYVDRTAEKES